MAKTYTKATALEMFFDKSAEERTRVAVESVNGHPKKIYIRTFITSERYTGPSKEGMSLTLEQAVALEALLKTAIESF